MHPPVHRAPETLRRAAWLVAASLFLPGMAAAQTHEVRGSAIASAYQLTPLEDVTRSPSFLFSAPQPGASLPQTADGNVLLSNGARAQAKVTAAMGTLKAYAHAAYAYSTTITGMATANASVTFSDTVPVQGGALPMGTPVTYRFDVSVDASFQQLLGTPGADGNFVYALATALVRVRDTTTQEQVQFTWDPRVQSNGLYSVNINTTVGSQLYLTGNIQATAQATSYGVPLSPHTATADLGHTALYYLVPSVAGLNTMGLSGHDYVTAAVPEPATWVTLLGGLVLLGARRGARRFALPDA
jgi:hypothetical protein